MAKMETFRNLQKEKNVQKNTHFVILICRFENFPLQRSLQYSFTDNSKHKKLMMVTHMFT